MTQFYKGQKRTEIIILSVAIAFAVIAMVILHHSVWLIIPYFLLEIGVLYFYLNYGYVIENKIIIIKYGFVIFKTIPIHSINRIFIREILTNGVHQVEIHYEMKKMQVVTPKNTVGFIENIEKVNPRIEIS
ncbi:MAG: hypothetical protein GX102_06745 [Porphyromonadaceae bacterium]|nr:hypothetical protein [Porphyromonadaceae bacterium]